MNCTYICNFSWCTVLLVSRSSLIHCRHMYNIRSLRSHVSWSLLFRLFFFFSFGFSCCSLYRNKQKQKLALSLPKKNLTCSISKFFICWGILGQPHSNMYFLSLIFWLTFNNLLSQRWDGKRLKTSQGEPLIYSLVFLFLPTSPPFFALTRLHFGGKHFLG